MPVVPCGLRGGWFLIRKVPLYSRRNPPTRFDPGLPCLRCMTRKGTLSLQSAMHAGLVEGRQVVVVGGRIEGRLHGCYSRIRTRTALGSSGRPVARRARPPFTPDAAQSEPPPHQAHAPSAQPVFPGWGGLGKSHGLACFVCSRC